MARPKDSESIHQDCQTETSDDPRCQSVEDKSFSASLSVRIWASSGKLTNDPFSARLLQSLKFSPSELIRPAASMIVRPLS